MVRFGTARQYDRAWLTDLSIVLPPKLPAYNGAQIIFIVGHDLPYEPKAPARRAPMVEHRDEPGQVLVRPGKGYVIGVSEMALTFGHSASRKTDAQTLPEWIPP